MFEHVGIDNHRTTYFATMNRLLKPGGLYLHHAIVRRAKRTDKVFRKKSTEYAALSAATYSPAASSIISACRSPILERHGFEVHDVEAWREHYARTTRLWHDRLLANFAAAEREVGAVKTRMWLILSGRLLRSASNAGRIGIFQTLASKRERGASGLPPSRADLYR